MGARGFSGAAPRTLALVLPKRRGLVTLRPAALTRAQAPRATLAAEYRGAMLLYPDGVVRRIETVRVLGPSGASLPRRLLSRLTKGWRIEAVLSEPLSMDVAALRALMPEAGAAFADARSPAELYRALDLPPVEDALDVL
jgi:hypothetical protein